MRKINNRKSLILAAGGGKYVPNIVRGGNAIPLGDNFYYIKGRKHSAGGVDIGADPKTGLEVEGEEVMKVTPKEVRVYSSVPFLQGNSPAELVMGGANPDAVFNAQEEFKNRNRINDDGTKYKNGGNKTTVQQDAIANYKPDLKYNNYENFEKAKSNAFNRALEDSRLQRKLLKASVQIADPTGLSTSVPAIIKGIAGNSVPSDWLDVLGSVPRVRSLSNLLRYRKNRGDFSKAVILKDKENEYRHLADEFVDYATKNIDGKNAEYAKRTIKQANDILKEYRKVDKIINPIENAQYAVRGVIQNQDIRDAIDSRANKKPLGGNLPTNQNDFLDTWNASRLATGRYNNQLGDGRLERQAESRNTAREFHSPIGFAMNYGKRAAIRTPSMSDTDYRKEIARNAQSMKLRLNTPETGQGVIGGAYHAPTHSSYINQEEFAKDATVRTHENAHASRAAEQEQVISDILGSSSSSDYLRRPTEVYSRLMQFRQANNLDPNTVYDKDSFRELRKTATDYNLINTFKEDEVIDLLNNVAMSNDPNQLNLNNINLNTVPVYAAKYGTKRKSKMGKVISINGNVRNGLIHTPSREAFAYGGERKPRNYVDGVTGAARRVPTTSQSTPQLIRNITNGLANNAPTYKKNGETHYFVEAPTVSVPNSDYDMDALQRMILSLPVGTRSNTSSSSTGSNNKRQSVSIPVVSINPLDGSKVVSASDENAAMIRRNLAPTVVNRLTKNANNDINYLPIQEDIAKTRNLDNIQFGINLGSSAIDALMSNIFVNQLHSYTPPTITAPVISNSGEIKLNEEDLKDIPEPILMAAAKLKTRYNVNPQLAKIEDETRRTMRDIDRNTSNSRVGLARKQLAALRGQEAKNQVYAQKENIETELINKDKLNQQEVTARNLARYDQYNQALAAQMANRARLRLAADTANIQNKLAVSTANANLKAQADQFNAGNRINSLIHKAGIDGAKAEARANIVSNLLENVGSAFDIWNRNKRQARLDEETLKVLGLRAPNVNKLMLRALGINE